MKEIDIASFAEGLLNEEVAKGKPVQFAAAQSPNAPDVSDIEVPSDFASQILTEGHWDKAQIKVAPQVRKIDAPKASPIREATKKDTPALSEEVQLRKNLFEDYRQKLQELDSIVQEMTTVGMIGAGASSPSPKKESPKARLRKKARKVKRSDWAS